MTTPSKSHEDLLLENAELRARLEEAEETLRAIRSGEVDALVMRDEVFTLKGAETPYRALIERMYEGAATLLDDGTVLYANRCLGELLKVPLQSLIGSSLRRFVPPAEVPVFDTLLAEGKRNSSKGEFTLQRLDGTALPVQLAFSAMQDGETPSICVVATDLTDRRRAELALQASHDALEQRVLDRTEQLRQASEALRLSEERLDLALRAAQDGVWDWNLETGAMYYSPRYKQMLGYAEDDLEPHVSAWERLLHPDDKARVREVVAAVLRGEGEYEMELRLRHNDGHYLQILSHGFPVRREPRGPIVRIVGTHFDLTERKQAEEALQAALDRFYSALSSMSFAALLVDEDDRIDFANQAFCDMFNLKESPADLKRLTSSEMLEKIRPAYLDPEADLAHIRELVARAVLVQDEEVPMEGGRTFLRDFIPIRSGENKRGRLWIHKDITERKRAEEKSRELHEVVAQEKDRLSALVNSISDEIWFADTDGTFTLANPSASREFAVGTAGGTDVRKLAGELEVRRPDGSPRPIEEAPPLRALRGEIVQNQEEIVRTPASGELRYRQVSSSPVKDTTSKIIGSVSVVRDITERKRAEEALRVRAEDALRMSEQEFRSLAEAVPQIVWATRSDGSNIYFNQHWVDYTGMTMEESYGHGWNTPFHPDDKQRAWEAWQRATQHHELYSLECRLRRHDGVYRWWLIRGEPMRGANGEILKWFGTCTDIEDIKRAEAALREANDSLEQRVAERTAALQASEHRFRLALQNAPVSVAMQDRNLVYQWAYNQRTRRPDEIVGKTDADLFAPEDVAHILEVKRRVLESGTEVHDQHWLTSNGKRLLLDLYYEPTRDAAGAITGIGIAVVDLTKQKVAEEALRESQAKLKAAFASMTEAIFIADAEGRLVDFNEAFVRYHRFKDREDCSRTIAECPRYLEAYFQDGTPAPPERWAMARAIRGETASEVEYRLRHKETGETWWGSYNFAPIKDQDGTIVGGVVAGREITERKRAEEALRRSEQLYRAIGESMDYGVWVCEADGRNIYASPNFLKLVGITQEQCSSFGWGNVLHPDDAKRTIAAWKECVRTGGTWDIEHRFRGVDGQWHPILARGVPVRDEHGQITCWVGINLDIQQLKQVEEALRASNQELNRFNQAMIGRELRMVELKQEINALRAQLGQPPRYHQTE